MKLFVHIIILRCSIISIFTQEINHFTVPPPSSSPIPIEVMLTGRSVSTQIMLNKKFTGNSKLGFLGVVNSLNTYQNNKDQNEFMTLSMVSYNLINELSINTGVWMHNKIGLRPTVAVHYTKANENFVLADILRIDMIKDHTIENVLILEYFPKISKNWSLYNRLQTLYSYNTKQQTHERSYINARMGVSFKNFRFGAGANLDYYGSLPIHRLSIGVFAGTILF